MVDPDRRPTAQEIEELIDLVRRDPASPAFIDLGEAYLNLGRPRDAIQVGNLGLENAPDNLEGRVMLARAFAAMHQWKEAQGELLRVVKLDRSNRAGFALLGEVLLRRADFERAVPVLQHAQNLDPTSPQILAMLRRARAGQQLDPPAPIPTPVAPRGETDVPVKIERSQRSRGMAAQSGDAVTTVAPPTRSKQMPVAPPPAPDPVKVAPLPRPGRSMQMASATPAPELRQYSGLDALTGGMEPEPPAPPPSRPASPPLARPASPTPEAPLPVVAKSQPRPTPKPMPAPRAQPRRSGAPEVGENYLNELLVGGGIVTPAQDDMDVGPAGKRWGRSTRNTFIFLFVILVLGIGGGGGWYWYTEKKTAEAVEQFQTDAKAAIGQGEYAGFVESLDKLTQALDKDKSNKLTFAYYVESAGLSALLYGETRVPNREEPGKPDSMVGTEVVDAAHKGISVGEDAIQPGEPGYREMLLGKIAADLARLPNDRAKQAEAIVVTTQTRLPEILKSLDDHIAKNKTDKWAIWLKGRAMLAQGSRRAAASILKEAAEGSDGLVVAMVDYANLLVDDGKLTDALALFDKAAQKSKGHPLVILGQALAKVEASIDVNETIGDLNGKFAIDKIPTRVAAYRWLALAIANLNIEEYPAAIEALTKASVTKPPPEPRFWSRIAWAHYRIGRPAKTEAKQVSDFENADRALAHCIYYGKAVETDPTMQLVDAGLSLARGLPDKTLDVAAKIDGIRPRLLRTYALLDLGKSKEAFDEASELLKTAPGPNGKPCEEGNDKANFEAKILCEQARMLSNEKERKPASDELLELARKAKSKLGRHALGVAYLQLGDLAQAKEHLGMAIKDVTDASPNPFQYRTLTALAEIALLEKEIETAYNIVGDARKINTGYLPTQALLARILVRNKQPDEALTLLTPILAEAVASTPVVQLTLAEALVTKKEVTEPDKKNATDILTKLKDAPGIPAEEIGRIALLIDPELPKKLGVPVPPDPAKPGEKPKQPAPPKRPGKK